MKLLQKAVLKAIDSLRENVAEMPHKQEFALIEDYVMDVQFELDKVYARTKSLLDEI
jgi:hypothetical protein